MTKAILLAALVSLAGLSEGGQASLEDARHVVERLGFGARPGDVERVAAMGLAAYIDEQLHPDRIPDARLAPLLARFETLGLTSSEMAGRYFVRPGQEPADRATRRAANVPLLELSQQKILRAVYSERQLEELLVDFWFNHFNVFAGKGQFARFYLTEYEREAIRPHVLGRFRDMLGATAASPAMLWYLDNWMSNARRGLNENYARELLELHTLGVDGGYTQDDVVNVARAFTGWTIAAPRRGGGDFTFNARIHDQGEKIVLGRSLPAGGGRQDGERVLDMLASHPSTARHIARKLAIRFIGDAPPESVIGRAAAVFLDSGGDLRAVTRSILTSPEFMSTETRRAKVKTPLEFAVSALRATEADVVDAAPLVQQMRALGMPLYGAQPPTGYDDAAASWINSGALLARMNFAVALVENRIRGTRVKTADPKAEAVRLGSVEFQRR